jgi:hypothetical protein
MLEVVEQELEDLVDLLEELVVWVVVVHHHHPLLVRDMSRVWMQVGKLQEPVMALVILEQSIRYLRLDII